MTSNRLFLAIVLAISTCYSSSPVFAAAPAGLRNKTIHISYSIAVPRRGSDGKESVGTSTITRTIYVSSLGRAFIKRADFGGRKGHARSFGEAAPEDPGRTFQFEGSRMILTTSAGDNGAEQVTISFDSRFRTCSVTAKFGSSGSGRSWVSFKGERFTATGPTSISNATCSIEDGNGIAQ